MTSLFHTNAPAAVRQSLRARTKALAKRTALITLLSAAAFHSAADSRVDKLSLHSQFMGFNNASLVIESAEQKVFSRNASTELVPASTVKVLTALRAIEKWGLAHQFKTEFYFDALTHTLWVKGYGDPFLVSEELQRIAINLATRLPQGQPIKLGLDTSYFAPTIIVDGRGKTNNPYDAPLSAIAVNFNTINVRKNGATVTSAESQTPITPIAKTLAKPLSNGKQRINIGNQDNALAYFSELLQAFMQQHDYALSANYQHDKLPETAELIYTHQNQFDLAHQIKGMLKYSNNFIANQLFMLLSDTNDNITITDAQQAATRYVHDVFGWQKTFYDGAGLSRKNALSAEQLLSILTRFEPHKALMNCQEKICAKTGTLTGVSTLAGYIEQDVILEGSQGKYQGSSQGGTGSKKSVPFALMINEAAPYRFRHNYMSQWSQNLNTP